MTPFRHRHALVTLVAIAVLAAILPLAAPSVRAGTATVFSEDFESGAIGPSWNRTDGNNASGLDYWGITGYRTHAGTYSAWAAQVGTQSDSGLNNSAVNRYDDDMRADLSIDLRADGFGSLTLSFWYYSRAESGGGDFVEAWYEAGGSPFQIFQNTGGTGNAWDSVSVTVPTTVERLIIRFVTDGANHNFEGAYVDDILLTGTEATPPTSSVSPLPTYANVVPYDVPYVAQDNPNASGVAYVELWYRQGTTGAYSLYNDTANPTGRWTAPPIPFDPPGGDGYYEFYTVAVDNAQNAEAPPLLADANLTFDTAAPSLAITAPSDGAWAGAIVTVAWQGSDATSGIASFETSLDGGAFSPAGLAVSREFSGLAEGPHDVEVRATDSAGNSATSNVTFGVDTVAPSVSITAPSDGRLLHTSSVTLRWTGSDATSGIDRYEVWVDSGAPQATTDLQRTFTGLRDGTHTFHVRAIDEAGNAREVQVRIRINTTVFSWDGPYGPFPLLLLIILALAALLGILLWWGKRRDADEERKPPTPETAEEPEPLEPQAIEETPPEPPEPSEEVEL